MLSVEAEPRYDYKLTAQRTAAVLGLVLFRLGAFVTKVAVATVEIATSDDPLTELKGRLHGAARRAGTRLDSVRAGAKGLTAGIVGAEVSRWRTRPTSGMSDIDGFDVESEPGLPDDGGAGPDAPNNVVDMTSLPVWRCVNGHTGLSQRVTACRHCGGEINRGGHDG